MTDPTPLSNPGEKMSQEMEPVSVANRQPHDPAGEALAEALQLSFKILKLVMLAIVVVFAISGFYKVEQNEQAIVLRFGKVLGTGSSALQSEGLHWKWPEPIDEAIKVPSAKAIRQLNVDDFWYYQSESEKLGLAAGRPGATLQFVRDGYSLTASTSDATFTLNETGGEDGPLTDYNLVHSRWLMKYSITDPMVFVEKLWNGHEASWHHVEAFLRNVLSEAVTMTCANRDINWIIWLSPRQFSDDVQRRLQDHLQVLDVGITASLDFVDKTPPRQVGPAFDAATSARSEKKGVIGEATSQKSQILSNAKAEAQIMVGQAQAWRTRLVEAARSDAKYLDKVVGGIEAVARNKVPDGSADVASRRREVVNQLMAVTVDQLYQEAIRSVIANADETIVLNTNGENVQWRPILSRDPSLKKKAIGQ
jgi:membrane protease subunit HflK